MTSNQNMLVNGSTSQISDKTRKPITQAIVKKTLANYLSKDGRILVSDC